MWEAANSYGVPPLRLSLQGTRNHFHNFMKEFLKVNNKKILKIYRSLLKVIIHKLVPLRPDRVEPRKVKRRPKAFPHMQEPRKLERQKLVTV